MGHHLLSLTNSLTVIIATAVLALAIASIGTDASGVDAANSKQDVNGGQGNNNHRGNDTHDTHHAHGVTVAHLQFEYVEQPLILSLFLIHVVLIKIGTYRNKSVLLLLSGFLLTTFVVQVEHLVQCVSLHLDSNYGNRKGPRRKVACDSGWSGLVRRFVLEERKDRDWTYWALRLIQRDGEYNSDAIWLKHLHSKSADVRDLA